MSFVPCCYCRIPIWLKYKFLLIYALLRCSAQVTDCCTIPSTEFHFCHEYQSFGCCVSDDVIEASYYDIIHDLSSDERDRCSEYVRTILCQKCSPYAAHLYVAESNPVSSKFPSLCPDYYNSFRTKCGMLHANFTNNTAHDYDPTYCYPEILAINERTSLGEADIQGNCTQLCMKEVINDIYSPTSAKPANDGTGRMFVVEQRGVVWVYLSNFTKLSPPFIDIQENVEESGRAWDERGLLDIAFHPNFSSNGRFFLHYTRLTHGRLVTRISEFLLSDVDMNRGNASTEKVLMDLVQPSPIHCGGPLFFLDDGFLYIFTGDGGNANDPHNNGQNKQTLLGKGLRVDVDQQTPLQPYSIPIDNPFVNTSGVRAEIFAYGLRNPWKCSSDRGDQQTGEGRGRIFCGDVGQRLIEEVNLIKSGGNYGWKWYEGNVCKRRCSNVAEHVPPIGFYTHDEGRAVTGGYVYRGCQYPNLNGKYIFGDWFTGRLYYLQQEGNGNWSRHNICMGGRDFCINVGLSKRNPKFINSFAEDESGEFYVVSTSHPQSISTGGRVYKLVDPTRRGNPLDCRRREHREVIIHPNATLHPYLPVEEQPLQIRLVNAESRRNYGRVEIRRPGQEWGGICNRGWTKKPSSTLCRQLGFRRAIVWAHNPIYGNGTGMIWLDYVRCIGYEKSILGCAHRGWGVTNCTHAEQASVVCR